MDAVSMSVSHCTVYLMTGCPRPLHVVSFSMIVSMQPVPRLNDVTCIIGIQHLYYLPVLLIESTINGKYYVSTM